MSYSKTVLSILTFILLTHFGRAQNLAVSEIPEELLVGANAVVRFDKTIFEIESPSSSYIRKHWAITILNDRSTEEHASFRAFYDKFSKVKKIEGILYDSNGEVIKKLHSKDMQDYSMSAFSNGVFDNRVILAQFSTENISYPFTVEFSFEKQDKNMMFFPSWSPISEENLAVMASTFEVNANNIPFRVLEQGIDRPEIKKSVTHPFKKSWSAQNLKRETFEKYSHFENLPLVLTAPTVFEIEKYQGQMNSWSDISSFYAKLNEHRDQLPEDTKKQLASLIKPGMTQSEKVKITYEFMQSHTRYMSIQLGIGGWQTMEASEVAKGGYGDCKALTNYTIALLKSIDIQAFPVLIMAGKSHAKNRENFPNMSFNHVIACVPSEKDTIWLECTSQTEPMGFLGSFTGNRKGLLIKPEGGHLVNTKSYLAPENFQKRTAEVWLEQDGNANVTIRSSYGGIQQMTRTGMVLNGTEDEKKEYLNNNIKISSFELGEFDYKIHKKVLPEIEENISLKARKLASASGTRLFFKANILSGFYSTPIEKEERTTALFLNPNVYTVEDSDEILFHIPEGYKTEKSPNEILLESPFGTYVSRVSRADNNINYYRKVTLTGGTYDKALYTEWVNFIKSINKADNQRIVLVKGGT